MAHRAWRVAGLVGSVCVAGGRPARAQRADWQVQALATVAATPFFGAGVGWTLRPADRLRLSVVGSGGVDGTGQAGARGELLVTFPADPYRTRGVGVYGGGGIAIMAAKSRVSEYLVLVLGLERAPGAPKGWFAEVGVGGGIRLALGYRIRSIGPK